MLEPKYLFTILLLGTVVVITYATRKSPTTVQYWVAGRSFGWLMNGSAIAGDYLSAATFLGLAGLTFALGYDGIFYTFGFSIGLTLLALFLAGPLRRFGRFTVPDFLGERFHSRQARIWGVVVVLAISGFYAAPQILGAAQIMQLFFGTSYQFGVIFTAIVMMFYVGIGGMRGTTFNQALEIWIRFTAFLILVGVALAAGYNYPKVLSLISQWVGSIPGTGAFVKDGKDLTFNGHVWEYTGTMYKSLWMSLSLVIGLAFGTMGLPHILLRFYTNPNEKDARYSAVFAIFIASAFFTCALYLGTVGRYVFMTSAQAGILSPNLMKAYIAGGNMVVPALAETLGGPWLLGFVIAGAFAAIFSNLSGLWIASSGALGHDIYSYFINPNATEQQRVRAGRLSVVIVGIFYGILGLLVQKASIGHLVGLAFCVAASTYAPVFLLGVWWRGITEKGAIAGLVVGLLANMILIFGQKFMPPVLKLPIPGAITVPLGFLAVWLVSLWDGKVPADVNEFMRNIHAPRKISA
jgi:cation/acetate symporter